MNVHFPHIAFRKAVPGQESVHVTKRIFQKQSQPVTFINKRSPNDSLLRPDAVLQAADVSRQKSLEVTAAASADSRLSACPSQRTKNLSTGIGLVYLYGYTTSLVDGSIPALFNFGQAAVPSSGNTEASQLCCTALAQRILSKPWPSCEVRG